MQEFWRASPQQIYAELHKLDERGLIEGKFERQSNRPQKRTYSLSASGETELYEFTRNAPRRPVVRDEMMVKLYAIDAADEESVIESLAVRAQEGHTRVEQLRVLVIMLRGDLSHEEYLRTGSPIGPYLTCMRGIAYELENAGTCEWLVEVMRVRSGGGKEKLPKDPVKFD